MKVIICGGRDYRLTPRDYDWLNTLPITAVLSGNGRGVDRDAEYWAQRKGLPVTRVPAQWDTYGKAAGPIRNQAMVAQADGCVAFPGGRGTADCVRRAKQAGLQIWERLGAWEVVTP
jgi:hypothetical protein